MLTLRASTRSAASMRVRVEIWSTIAEILELVGGGGAEDEAGVVEASAAATRAAEKDRTETRELLARTRANQSFCHVCSGRGGLTKRERLSGGLRGRG